MGWQFHPVDSVQGIGAKAGVETRHDAARRDNECVSPASPAATPRSTPRVVLLVPTVTYRAPDFMNAARELGIEAVIASDHSQAMAESMGDRALVIPFDDPDEAAARIVESARETPVDAVVPVDEAGVVPAALAARELGLAHNPPEAVAATRDKAALRRALGDSPVPQPAFAVAGVGDDVGALAEQVGLPCVVKPVSLSASRGVIRADTAEDAAEAAERVREVLRHADPGAEAPPDPDGPLLVEAYVPGAEVAVEGLLVGGRVEILALFDKPDPMEGPFFAETLLVAPSRLPDDVQAEIRRVVSVAAESIGLREGPIHAEVRVDPDRRVWFLELAARSIGGLCARTLRFGTGMGLEEVVLRHAAGLPLRGLAREASAAGVAMLYPPKAGTLSRVGGVERAEAVPGIESVDITLRPGAEVRPLPDSSRYLGFVFARGDSPEAVEAALSEAVGVLEIVVDAG